MLPYLDKKIILFCFIIIHVFMFGCLVAVFNNEFSINSGSYQYIFLSYFSIKSAFIPIIVIISPILSIIYHKNPDRAINVYLLLGSITYLMYAILFNYYSLLETFILFIGFTISYTTIFFLTQRLLTMVSKSSLVIFFVCSCHFITLSVMMLIDLLFRKGMLVHGRSIVWFLAFIYFIMLIFYILVTDKTNLRLNKPFKLTSEKYFIYLINFFKHRRVLLLSGLFFLNGFFLGLIDQYIFHYISQFNYQDLINSTLFESSVFLVFAILFILIGLLLDKGLLKNINHLILISSFILFMNILLVLIYRQNYILNVILLLNRVWLYSLFFAVFLIYYFNYFKACKFDLMMIVGFILKSFGFMLSQWINICFLNLYISLYCAMVLAIIFLILKFKKIIAKTI